MKFTKLILAIFFICPLFLFANPSDKTREMYAKEILTAFQLQGMEERHANLALIAFNDGVKLALTNGESPAKIRALQDLFFWYRRYGYHGGLLKFPSGCQNEYQVSTKFPKLSKYSNLDPHQQKLIKDFLLGVGSTISSVFCAVVYPPIGGKLAIPLISFGIGKMWDALNEMWQDNQEKKLRLEELENLQKKLAAVAPKINP